MKLVIEIDKATLTDLVLEHISKTVNVDIKPNDIAILVKSRQNYKAEWEHADFKAVCDIDTKSIKYKEA